jgi:hypothetical protein
VALVSLPLHSIVEGCSQIQNNPWTGTTYINSSYKMLMDTHPREYNKFETWVFVVHTFFIFLYANRKMHGFRIV